VEFGNVISSPFLAVGLFVSMLVCLELGRRLGLRKTGGDAETARKGLEVVEGAFFALFGLLLAFTFSGAGERFDQRRGLIVEESNDIGTAYLRIDLLPTETQPALRDLFRKYVDSRLAVYRKLPDIDAALQELAASQDLQNQIWSQSVAASGAPGAHPSAPLLLLPAVNAMIDITSTRTMAARAHPPVPIFWLLFLLGLICAGVAGHGMSRAKPRPWPHTIGFALIICLTIFVTLNMEYPRLGLIRLSVYDQVLVDVRQSMK